MGAFSCARETVRGLRTGWSGKGNSCHSGHRVYETQNLGDPLEENNAKYELPGILRSLDKGEAQSFGFPGLTVTLPWIRARHCAKCFTWNIFLSMSSLPIAQ